MHSAFDVWIILVGTSEKLPSVNHQTIIQPNSQPPPNQSIIQPNNQTMSNPPASPNPSNHPPNQPWDGVPPPFDRFTDRLWIATQRKTQTKTFPVVGFGNEQIRNIYMQHLENQLSTLRKVTKAFCGCIHNIDSDDIKFWNQNGPAMSCTRPCHVPVTAMGPAERIGSPSS